MANNFKRRSLKGVVLIMVVTVMLMLIILLLATMAVVSTAQNRYYTKFEENQAYYTARSALDVYVSNIFSDESYLAYDGGTVKQYSYTVDPTAIPPTVDTVDMKQGLAMQLDTYRIKAHSDTMENYNLMADKTQFSTDHWANATNDIFNTGSPEKTYYEVPDLDYIDYQIEFPKVENGTNSYGGIVDTDSSNKQIAKIRVEVLARTYNGHSAAYPASPSPTDVTDDKTAINNGDRYKDAVYLKATSIVEFQGVEGTASVVFSAPEMENQFTSAITAAGAISGIDNGIVIDGYATPDPVVLGNMGIFVGQSYSAGLVEIPHGGSTITMSKGECTYFDSIDNVTNNFYMLSLVTNPAAADRDIPVMFVDGDCTFNNQVSWGGGNTGTRDNQVDLVVVGNFNPRGDLNVNGNIIVKGDLILDGNNLSLASGCHIFVGGDIIMHQTNIKNSLTNVPIYCCGDFVSNGGTDSFPNITTPGAGLHMKPGALFGTNGIKDGTYFLVDLGTDCHIQDALLHDYGTISKLGTTDADAFNYLDVTADVSSAGSKVYLPTLNVAGDGIKATSGDSNYERYVPSEYSKYCTYWRRSNTAPYLYQTDGMGNHIYVSAEEMAGTTKKSDRDVGNYTALDFTTPPAGATNLPSGGTVSVAGTLDYIMNGGNYNIKIEGTGTANIYVRPGGTFTGRILSDDKTKVNFYFPIGTYTWNLANYSQSVFNGFTSGLHFGQDDPARLPALKIRFYASAGAAINNTQTGWGLFTGYIYAPQATITATKGLDGYSYQYYYNGGLVTTGAGSPTGSNPIIIGAIVCNSFAIDQNAAICFLKDEDTPEFGDPFWDSGDPFYYTRN